MVEVSEIGLKDDEVELDLGLSIGGSFRRSEKPIQTDSKPNGFELHPTQHQQQPQAWQGSFRDAKRESMAVVMDPQAKREIHALRRLEAKKKREEKQAQLHKRLVREPEPEPERQRRAAKREKTDDHDVVDGGGSECQNANLNLNGGGSKLQQPQGGSLAALGSTASFPHPYAHVQLNNAYAYPCVVPWVASCGKEKNAGQPAVACKGFRPFSGNGFGSDQNGDRDCGDIKKAKSDGSSMCSSSVVSDYQSSSHEGGGSTDSHSHSVHSLAEPTQLNSSKENNKKNNNIRSQPDQSASSHSMGSDHVNAESKNHTVTQPDETKLKEEQPTMDNKPKPSSNDKDSGKKPPKPLPHDTTPATPLLSKMPYVSTTGNGPNGRRVNGFLYRYSNSEVSIVCVCHGSTFSPAGFVQHAGGTDTTHPERHITVIPPAFG